MTKPTQARKRKAPKPKRKLESPHAKHTQADYLRAWRVYALTEQQSATARETGIDRSVISRWARKGYVLPGGQVLPSFEDMLEASADAARRKAMEMDVAIREEVSGTGLANMRLLQKVANLRLRAMLGELEPNEELRYLEAVKYGINDIKLTEITKATLDVMPVHAYMTDVGDGDELNNPVATVNRMFEGLAGMLSSFGGADADMAPLYPREGDEPKKDGDDDAE